MWKQLKEYDKAIGDYDSAIRHSTGRYRSFSLTRRGDVWKAKAEYRRAAEDYAAAINNWPIETAYERLAWVLATAPEASDREGCSAGASR